MKTLVFASLIAILVIAFSLGEARAFDMSVVVLALSFDEGEDDLIEDFQKWLIDTFKIFNEGTPPTLNIEKIKEFVRKFHFLSEESWYCDRFGNKFIGVEQFTQKWINIMNFSITNVKVSKLETKNYEVDKKNILGAYAKCSWAYGGIPFSNITIFAIKTPKGWRVLYLDGLTLCLLDIPKKLPADTLQVLKNLEFNISIKGKLATTWGNLKKK